MTKPSQGANPGTPAPGAPAAPPEFTEPQMPEDTPAEGEGDGGDADTETVTLAHHWTDPKTGKNHLPESEISIDPDSAATLRAAGIAVAGDGEAAARDARDSR